MLSVRDLHFSYGALPVLRDVSFDAASGEVCGLFGPNGCGKTTLFRCCLGLLQGRAERLSVDGLAVAGMPPRDRARLMAYVPQEHKPPFPLRVVDVVMLGRTPHLGLLGRASATDREVVSTTLGRLGLTDLAMRAYDRLSGGQRQLVLIARAVAQQTPVILLDEPASGLDFRNQVRIWRVLRELAAGGTAVVCCTHDPNHVAWFCDRAVVMQGGRVVTEGSPSDALDLATLDRLYPGVCTITKADGLSIVHPSGLCSDGASSEGR
jgi:iron complex transport system ATP-binding protein